MKRHPYPVEIYCDGACSGNPGKAGWAAIIQFLNSNGNVFNEEVVTGNTEYSTNNRAELKAILDALVFLNREGWRGLNITVYTDSQNAILWIKREIKRKEVSIRHLCERIEQEISKGRHFVSFKKVKGHSNHKLNERANNIAVMAIKWLKYKDEYVY